MLMTKPMAAADSAEMLRRLIGFDTTSRNSNMALIEFVQDYLRDLGVESTLVLSEDGRKANLFATIGPADKPGVVLSGHTDVVPVDGQDWATDPFDMVERDGRFWGRGTCDMKGFLAVALAHAPAFKRANLKAPIHYCLSYDEEVGCLGVHSLVDHLKTLPVRPRMCVVGEPTSMQVIIGHKGKLAMRCTVQGHACHSSLAPHGVNAVEYAAEVIVKLREMARRKAQEGPFDGSFDVAHTTVHTGRIKGGTALNIVPDAASFEFEFRHLPVEDPEVLLREVQAYAHDVLEPEMKAKAQETGFSWEPIFTFPGLDMGEEDEAVLAVKALARQNATARVAYGTEAGIFQQKGGIPTVICGPGSIEQAHKPNEFCDVAQIVACEGFMLRLVAMLENGWPASFGIS